MDEEEDIHEKLVNIIDKPTWKTILMDIVKSENMDPWNIDVGLLAKKYVEKINSMKKLNFRIPANAVLAAAIIVRFKSDVWDLTPQSLFEEELEEQTEWEYVIDGKRVPELTPSRRITKRKVTIEELIKAVEDVMEKERKRAMKRAAHIQKAPEMLVDVAFEDTEEFTKAVEDTYKRILEMKGQDNLVLFSNLLKEKTREEVIKTLLPLLHLANEQRIALWQEKPFNEIFISVKEEKHD